MPRPKVYWDLGAAVISYDAQIATSGITTVLDSLRVWRDEVAEDAGAQARNSPMPSTAARRAGLLRVSHFTHLRCEVPTPACSRGRRRTDRPDVRLLSLMDHTPGQRQFRDPVKLRDYYRGKSWRRERTRSLTRCSPDASRTHARYAADNYNGLLRAGRECKAPLASHDDTHRRPRRRCSA